MGVSTKDGLIYYPPIKERFQVFVLHPALADRDSIGSIRYANMYIRNIGTIISADKCIHSQSYSLRHAIPVFTILCRSFV
jgi:hypothetical protein